MSTSYDIGPFRLDPEAGALTHAGRPMALGARAVAVLAALVGHRNEYLSKASILDAAWPGVVVEENNLAVQISAIRRVFAQAPGGEHWIETLARRGYRFVGPVAEIRGAQPAAVNGHQHSNLPQPLTSFIGRERELADLVRLLRDTRLLTLAGIGGIGKTRLAVRAATVALPAYRDGAWLVDLAPLVKPALVPSAVAQVLGVREIAGMPLIDTLCVQLRGRQLLLLLDNCEHLAEACAQLADALLRSAADLTILATSREPLHVAGEQIYRLPALSLPLPDPAAGVEAITGSEAVQLFVERAQKQQPGFALTAARVPAVAELCIRLDGIPLALELAAARLRSLSVEQIGARLDDRFKLLTGGTRAALPRQQTLRATLDWSYDLLADAERAVLRRLAVFSGGFTLEAAAFVAAGGAIDEFAATDLLSQLVARSLVAADTSVADTRYRLLETTRAYALERLAEAGETERTERRHAQYYRSRFDPAPDDWMRMREEDWRAIYPSELDNVRAALDWAAGPRGDATLAVGLAGASSALWIELSLFDEGAERLEAALAQIDADTPSMDQARLWKGLGTLWGDGRAMEKAAAAQARAADLFRQLDDPLGLGGALVALGRMYAHMGRLEQAASVIEQASPVLERAGVPAAWGSYYNALGLLAAQMDDPAAGRQHFERALSLYQSAGAERYVFSILNNIADMTWMVGDLDAALTASLEVVARLRKSPEAPRSTVGICLMNLAGVHVERGELDAALAVAQEGLPLLREFGLGWYPLEHLALRAALAGDVRTAAVLAGFSDQAHSAKKMTRQPNEARARSRLQDLLREKIPPDQFERWLAEGTGIGEDEACRRALQE